MTSYAGPTCYDGEFSLIETRDKAEFISAKFSLITECADKREFENLCNFKPIYRSEN
jgi:hypothetical protein